MKKVFTLILILFFAMPANADIFSLNHNNENFYSNKFSKNLLDDLVFAEKQIFNKTYRNDDTIERLERLELALYGAIQSGAEAKRIKNIRKAVTNVASGGNGLQYVTKGFNLGGSSTGGGTWSFGTYNPYGYRNYLGYSNYNNCRYNNWSKRYSNFNRYHRHSHRLPPPACRGCRSHRLPPPSYYNNPIVNGDFMKDYSIGTSVKILDD